jgi:3-methyladenine DNA glycosylase AlkD
VNNKIREDIPWERWAFIACRSLYAQMESHAVKTLKKIEFKMKRDNLKSTLE